MDEPFAALDALTREQLYGDLQRIWKSRRKTIVFVTHNVREAVCLGDRVLLFSPTSGPGAGGIRNRAAATARHQQRRARRLCQPNHPRPQRSGAQSGGCDANETISPRRLFFAVLLALWQWAFARKSGRQFCCRRRIKVAEYLKAAATDGTLFQATVITMRRLLIGYVIGIIAGVPLGLLTARWNFLHDTIGTLALGLQTLPSVCWVPLALFWFGQTEAAMLFVVVMGTLWSVVIATDTGVRHVPPIYRRAALTMGSKRLHIWLKVILPAALPFIVSGMKQGWAFAWRSLMAAEIFVTILTGFGLGQLLHYGRELNAMDQVIGIMLVIVVIGLLADKILFAPVERFLHRRWGTNP